MTRSKLIAGRALLLLAFISITAQAAFAGRFVTSPPDAIPNRWLVMLEDSPRAVREEAEAASAGRREPPWQLR